MGRVPEIARTLTSPAVLAGSLRQSKATATRLARIPAIPQIREGLDLGNISRTFYRCELQDGENILNLQEKPQSPRVPRDQLAPDARGHVHPPSSARPGPFPLPPPTLATPCPPGTSSFCRSHPHTRAVAASSLHSATRPPAPPARSPITPTSAWACPLPLPSPCPHSLSGSDAVQETDGGLRSECDQGEQDVEGGAGRGCGMRSALGSRLQAAAAAARGSPGPGQRREFSRSLQVRLRDGEVTNISGTT